MSNKPTTFVMGEHIVFVEFFFRGFDDEQLSSLYVDGDRNPRCCGQLVTAHDPSLGLTWRLPSRLIPSTQNRQ